MTQAEEFEFDIESTLSSGDLVTGGVALEAPAVVEAADEEAMSPVFRELAHPRLPELPREARGRLLMQSPTRLFFYWSVGANAFAALHKALGNGTGGYRLALRLLDVTNQTEELHWIEAEGSWWFNVQPAAEYRAEVGFYSPSRPFVRILFSNTIETPRKGPSPHSASESRWAVTGGAFAEVLDASGFGEDASEVVEAGSGQDLATLFARHIGVEESRVISFDIKELRHALGLLADGTPIADLRWKISAELYALLEAHLTKLSAKAIRDEIGVEEEQTEEYETVSTVGGSLVNIRKPRYKPISSLESR